MTTVEFRELDKTRLLRASIDVIDLLQRKHKLDSAEQFFVIHTLMDNFPNKERYAAIFIKKEVRK